MNKTVAEIMTANPTTVSPQTSLQEAIQILAEKEISGLPVVDENGQLVGVISETDLTWQATGVDAPPYVMFLDSVIYLQNPLKHNEEVHKALGQTVEEAMSDRPTTVKGSQLVREAARIMHDKKVRRLPVVDNDSKLIGIITQGDVIKMMAAE
ncbi:CBS domain-containing protein [Waterburya agarophytonicola K14]|uniref:CBS domain-containing protein n=1 Tax=Waterburya agarophytonicola KI4 TaxID=2874699 RepID=A0A964BRM0_9CYAN|nr:CBS domain-containing protein [Waterburya agarophytonicola]MCC0178413.1 CBS domain-containing protein [Waterburya agarophytonicola KI4]